MYLEQFIYLQAIAQNQSISAAADKLFISHQALSRSIHNFEAELGCSLLVRTNRGVSFTEEGKYVLEIAARVVSALKDMNQHFQAGERPVAGELRLLFNKQEYEYRFSRVLSYFYKYYPALRLHYQVVGNADMVRMLNEGQADVGICDFIELEGVSNFNIPDTLIFSEFYRERLGVIFNKESPLSQYKKISLKTLSHYPVIINASDDADTSKVPAYFLMSGYGKVQARVASSNIMFTKFLEDNLGWAVCPSSVLKELRQSFSYCALQDKAFTIRGYIRKKQQESSALAVFFLNIYTEICR